MSEDSGLAEFRDRTDEFNQRHGFTAQEQGLVLAEETGELCEELLKSDDGKLFKDNSDPHIREEVGDVIYTAATIARLFGIDPFAAALDTARENDQRTDGDPSPEVEP